MRFVTLRTDRGTVAGRVEGDRIIELGDRDVGTLLARDNWQEMARHEGQREHRVEATALSAVVPAPGKVICVGLNYRSHIQELGRPDPVHPTLFAKYADSLIGPRDDIVLPHDSSQPDWEGELALVMGRAVRRADFTEARAAIAGFTILNDITMRDWQHRTSQWLQGKTFERSTPVGPELVTPDEVDWASDVRLDCLVDGQLMQTARTSELVFSPIDIVQYVSRITTLRPGDVIATGTPAGVAAGRPDEVSFLQPGQLVETRIEGLGKLLNRCVLEPGGAHG